MEGVDAHFAVDAGSFVGLHEVLVYAVVDYVPLVSAGNVDYRVVRRAVDFPVWILDEDVARVGNRNLA